MNLDFMIISELRFVHTPDYLCTGIYFSFIIHLILNFVQTYTCKFNLKWPDGDLTILSRWYDRISISLKMIIKHYLLSSWWTGLVKILQSINQSMDIPGDRGGFRLMAAAVT